MCVYVPACVWEGGWMSEIAGDSMCNRSLMDSRLLISREGKVTLLKLYREIRGSPMWRLKFGQSALC